MILMMEARMRRRLGVAVIPAAALLFLPACRKDENVVAPTLVATCEARPASGNAPLPVSFVVGVSGAEGTFGVSIAYGDGASGTNPDVPHTYTPAGSYVASFTVTTPTQSARCSTTVTVTEPPPLPANLPPTPVFKSVPEAGGSYADKVNGTAPLAVRWNMCPSSDPDADILWFLYDFDGDGRFDREGTTGAYCRTDYVYASGTWHTKLCVHDVGSGYEQLHPNQCKTFTVTVTP
jgi:hypothetical protein